MRINFLGHVSVDLNVVRGVEARLHGGGVLHGAITAKRLGAESIVTTMCAEGDRGLFATLTEAGATVNFLPSATSTSIRNVYPSENPDDRQSRIVSQARPFAVTDLAVAAPADVWHVNPLWFGEFEPQLLFEARKRTPRLAADAQGFLRHVGIDGQMSHRPWAEQASYLNLLDFFKADLREAEHMTGRADRRSAARALNDLGAKVVVVTHQAGVCVSDGRQFFESPFSPYRLEGRTGRGDTCMAAFLVNQADGDLERATRVAADVTSRKMQYAGAFRGL